MPVLVPFPTAGVGIETVATATLTPVAAGVETTTARRAREKASEKARKKRERQLDNLAEKEQNFKDVVEANIAFLKSQVGQNLHPMTTGPERKFAILLSNDQKPGVSVGDYVRVAKDTSPGMNRLEGYGFVQKVVGVGAATRATVKYAEVFGGLVHSSVLFADLTVAVFGQDWECEDLESNLRKGKRRRSRTTIPVTPSPERKKQHMQPQPEKKEPPADKLVGHLREGYWGIKAKGWHRKELNMMDPNRKRMNAAEKTQFLHEVALLEQFLSDPRHNNNHALKYKRSQKFRKRQSNWNPSSIRYLVEQAWGCSNSYLCDLRKAQKEFTRKLAATTEEAADLVTELDRFLLVDVVVVDEISG